MEFDNVMNYITKIPKVMHYITITLKDSELYLYEIYWNFMTFKQYNIKH